MGSTRPNLSQVRGQLARVVRAEVRVAAGEDRRLEDPERELLTPFVRSAAEGRSEVPEVVDEVVRRAAAAWAAHNQGRGSGKAWLSAAELAALRAADPALEELTRGAIAIAAKVKGERGPLRVELEAPPGVALATRGVRVVRAALSAGPGVPAGTRFHLRVDGQPWSITRTPAGFDVDLLRAPEGHGVEVLARSEPGAAVASAELKITRDPETALPHVLLVARAKAGLIAHLKNRRIHDPEWGRYFPTTWEENLARGIVPQIEAYFTGAGTDVRRGAETVTFAGPGPYQLLTEIELDKRDGRVRRLLVEID